MMPAYTTSMGYSLKRLLHGLTDAQIQPDVEVTGLSDDSRSVCAGDLFIAREGHRTSGTLYIEDALRAGAAAVVVETGGKHSSSNTFVPVIPVSGLKLKTGIIAARFYGDPSAEIPVIGVTGTNGKTTVSFVIARVLENLRTGTSGLIGTLGFGQSGHLTTNLNTTPGAIQLQHILRGMRDESINSVVMEVSSQGLDQGRVSGTRFHTAVFTNLTEEHLDYHGDMATYANTKKQLFLTPGLKYAVINTDDPYGLQLSREVSGKLHVIEYGLEDKPRGERRDHEFLSGVIIENNLDKLCLEVSSPWGSGRVEIHAGGRFNAYNSLASLAVLHLLGVDFDRAIRELSCTFPIPGRIETFRGRGDFAVVVDYAHTPDALENVLLTLREVCKGRLFCVFGCGGDRDRDKRPRMGGIAALYADLVILTNDNPRSEQPEAIIEGILAGIENRDDVTVQPDRAEAISTAISWARSGDIVLIAGKGHETYQEIGNHRFPFNDRQLVRNLLGEGG